MRAFRSHNGYYKRVRVDADPIWQLHLALSLGFRAALQPVTPFTTGRYDRVESVRLGGGRAGVSFMVLARAGLRLASGVVLNAPASRRTAWM
jgi:hypothetical protein